LSVSASISVNRLESADKSAVVMCLWPAGCQKSHYLATPTFIESKPGSFLALESVAKLARETLIVETLLDHVIVGQPLNGRSGYFSFKEAGMI
jgi:hypothetical protein